MFMIIKLLLLSFFIPILIILFSLGTAFINNTKLLDEKILKEIKY